MEFNLRRPPDEPIAPEEVILHYTDAAGVAQTESFKAWPHRLPDALLLEISNIVVDQNTVALFASFEAAFGEDYDRFHAFIVDPDRQVQVEDLVKIIEGLIELKSDRPTPPSSSS